MLKSSLKRIGSLSKGALGSRGFHLHEYQSKEIMREYSLNVQKGALAMTPEEALDISNTLNPKNVLILKAQVHAGGRGKGMLSSGLQGGVKICDTPVQVRDFTKQMIGFNLTTKQTSPEGLLVKSVLIHEGVNILKQIYLAIVMDRTHNGPAVIASKEGRKTE